MLDIIKYVPLALLIIIWSAFSSFVAAEGEGGGQGDIIGT